MSEEEVLIELKPSFENTTYRQKRTEILVMFIIETFGKKVLLLFIILLITGTVYWRVLPSIKRLFFKDKKFKQVLIVLFECKNTK